MANSYEASVRCLFYAGELALHGSSDAAQEVLTDAVNELSAIGGAAPREIHEHLFGLIRLHQSCATTILTPAAADQVFEFAGSFYHNSRPASWQRKIARQWVLLAGSSVGEPAQTNAWLKAHPLSAVLNAVREPNFHLLPPESEVQTAEDLLKYADRLHSQAGSQIMSNALALCCGVLAHAAQNDFSGLPDWIKSHQAKKLSVPQPAQSHLGTFGKDTMMLRAISDFVQMRQNGSMGFSTSSAEAPSSR